MPNFDMNKEYCSCHNPRGMLALPVGELWVKTTKYEFSAMMTDSVYGSDLNYIFEHYEDIIEIEFRSPDGSELLYRAF